MRAALARGNGAPIEIEEIELDTPGRGEVRVRIDASAVCRTDQLFMDNPVSPDRRFVPGHSACGTVVEVGPGVVKTKVGDRIVVAGTMECGRCYPCTHGSPSQCDRLWIEVAEPPVVGRTAGGVAVAGFGAAGTFAEYMNYREHCYAVVDSTLDAAQLALLGCGGLSGVGAVWEVGRVQPGDSVAVIGCGHLGLWMIQAAKAAGAGAIIAVDPMPERRDFALRVGATAVADVQGADTVIKEHTGGRGADLALEATGEAGGLEQAFAASRNGGTVVSTSMVAPLDSATSHLPTNVVSLFGRIIKGSQSGGGFLDRDVQRIAEAVEAGTLDIDVMITRVYPLSQAGEAMQAAVDRELITGVIDMRLERAGERS
ncbi:zinc-binding dehydrogenase [Microbacterium sp. F51-2R]|uniref:zinc-binding dehydrogenase n=1 Tax=Microbacterium sp. F51-2R TaxID=3445777 RepID=UPI003FA1686D